MKKGMFLSIAAATALFVSSLGINSADASQIQVKTYKVDYYQFNQSDINKMIESILIQAGSQYKIEDIIKLIEQIEPVKYTEVAKTPQVVSKPNNTTPAQPAQSQPTQAQPAQSQPTQAQPAQSQPTQSQPTPPPSNNEGTTEKEPTKKETSKLNAYEQEVVDLTNAERAKYGLSPLKVDEQLSEVARIKSADMQSNRYFDHTSPTYGSPFDMMKNFGVSYTSAGENIAYGQKTPEEVVNAWMNSDGHRKNILNSSYTHIGVGYVEQGNYWTQMFIGK
ncbi:CAP domain-containing protein [Chengkuizengella sediminis]|uniref:CAP domain-containing protein n=1 Tax=Chengkuizengella sediminis TaxID=1885917 RepID=UPI00138A5247|nr:CAP domain-containing protein [Chengkuizengella sediminis]NDI34948.1 serine protease [Chengkuizengella sediminis]